ncbi:MAG TPA: S8 family serine peptidase [Actinomycetota bacterium]
MGSRVLALAKNPVAVTAAILLVLSLAVVPAGEHPRLPALVDRDLLGARGFVDLIVRTDGDLDRAARAVRASGGSVLDELPIVDGFAARVPASALRALAAERAIAVLTPDRPVHLLDHDADAGHDESVYVQAIDADAAHAAGVNGAGVTVALVDTGVADVPDLAGRVKPVQDALTGRWSPCVNLSGEAGCDDSYGHGTFIAGIIAGDGTASGGTRTGVAPAASLVSIKIAGRDGAADVSNVLSAIQWVVSFKDRYGIGVLNLSLGTNGTQSYQTDPLNYAVQKAWEAGIVVVVSASNAGPDPMTIAKPGDDPWVITAGAIDDLGTPGVADDALPEFSARGPTAADGMTKPDLVAPGANVVSLDAPGSNVAEHFPNVIDGAYRKGSGTSASAAVVSGAAALMLQTDPATTPDRVKHAMRATASPAASADPNATGAGALNVMAALDAPPGEANAGLGRSNGLGFIHTSRGTVRVKTGQGLFGTVISASLTTQLLIWDGLGYVVLPWNETTWYASPFHGARWYGARWYGSTWSGARWYGARWYGEPDGARWYGAGLEGARWYGAWK